MVNIPANIIDMVKRYIFELNNNNIDISGAYLFGSYVNGTYQEWSDIDVALISDKFEGNRFYDIKKIARITINVNSQISPLPFKPEDFTPDNFFVKEIIDTGYKLM